ncbi:MAG: HAMP domain-containing protein, partial [Actinobacteria bacterium]|nr:HAMP domain-containing protein [Actinomycetota bacterium]
MSMGLGDRLTRLAVRPHLPRRTLRLRLTALYGALFLASGAGLLAVTYVLVSHATGGCYSSEGPNGARVTVCRSQESSIGRPPTEEASTQETGGPEGSTPPQAEDQARLLEKQAVAQRDAQLHQLLVQSGIALGAMAIVSIVLGWIVAGRVLRPLRTITTAARRISATSLHQRLALAGSDDELKELGDTFDNLLARLERSFDAQRRFVANASHELRTPLARQRAVAQVALADPDATVDSLRAAYERVLASGAQQERLIEALLTLARGQAGLGRRDLFDLANMTGEVLHARRGEAKRQGLDLRETLTPAPAAGDPRLVERLIANLVDNAIYYNLPDGHIDVVTGMRDERAVLSVANSGVVVPATEVDRLFQPFQRLGTDRTGHG